MAVGQPMPTVPRYTGIITTVDPSQRLIEIVLQGSIRQVSVVTVPIAFRWPVVGETWMIRQENGSWYLDGPTPVASTATSTPISIEGIAPGDAVINSPTGVVHVMGSSDGSTDSTVLTSLTGLESSMTVTKPTRIEGTIYQPSTTRATMVIIEHTLQCVGAQSEEHAVYIGPHSPPVTLIGIIACITSTGSTQITTANNCTFLVPPGWYWMLQTILHTGSNSFFFTEYTL